LRIASRRAATRSTRTTGKSFKTAIDGIYRHAPSERSLIEIASYFGLGREGSLRSRLAAWLAGGKYAGLFDNDEDRFKLDARFCYFNTTRIIQDEVALLAVLEYVFIHRIDLVMDGEPFIIVLEEGWKLRRSPYFRARIDDWLMTVRKKNGVVIFITPDIGLSYDENSDSLVKQPVTFLYFACDPRPTSTITARCSACRSANSICCGSGNRKSASR